MMFLMAMFNKYCYPYTELLTIEEEKAREEMINLFIPVLKFMFLSYNPNEFARYCFNSCRQTAILGAYYLQSLLPDYDIRAYEGDFEEDIDGRMTPYIHAYIIASNGNRELLVDLSRTSKRLLFHPVFANLYPISLDYASVIKYGHREINLIEMLETDIGEYYTSMTPMELIKNIKLLIADLKRNPTSIPIFRDRIFAQTTQIPIWR